MIAAAGDIACAPSDPNVRGSDPASCQQAATSDVLLRRQYATVLALGDLQYDEGTRGAFAGVYGPSWGRVRARTHPVPGNHEYETPGAAGYFAYFGARAGSRGRGWYSFDVGSWHLVALNSNCAEIGGCGIGSAQGRWLRADLARHPRRCTLAFWHHPRFSSGNRYGDNPVTAGLWRALQDVGADVVLVGHEHGYERIGPLSATGLVDRTRGIRSFVVGTGGRSHYGFRDPIPGSEVRDASSFGVLELTLGAGRYTWRFRPAVGSFADAGSASCH